MPTIKKKHICSWKVERKPQEGRQHSNTRFYQSTQWRNLRALKLGLQPLCEECLRNGKIVTAQMVDHIVPINKKGERLDIKNLQSLCHHCHNKKSAKEK